MLDTAERLWICDLVADRPSAPNVVAVRPTNISQRARIFNGLGIQTLLCGAVSRPLHNLLVNSGIVVRPWLTGAVEEVLAAYSEGRLGGERFLLPGYRHRRQRDCLVGNRGGAGKGRKNREPL